MPELPRPTPYETAPPPVPSGNRVIRGATQLLRGRLPYVLSVPFDQLCNRLGFRLKTVEEHGLTIRLRRQTADESFVYKILSDEEYTPAPHYSIGPTDTVIDIGGNIGIFSMHAARQASRGRVLTYEPVSENFSLLIENLRRNGSTNVVAHQLAVAGKDGPVKIFTTPKGHEATGSHSMKPEMAGTDQRFETLAATTLPAIFEKYQVSRCHFLKVDCEGAEFEIFEGTPSAVFQKIDRIAMEYHTSARDPEEKHRQAAPLLARLVSEGFRIDDYLDSIGFRSGFIRARRV